MSVAQDRGKRAMTQKFARFDSGDGNTVPNLPDLRGCFARCAKNCVFRSECFSCLVIYQAWSLPVRNGLATHGQLRDLQYWSTQFGTPIGAWLTAETKSSTETK